MRQNNRANPQLAKKIARQKYKEIVQLHEQYNIKVYG